MKTRTKFTYHVSIICEVWMIVSGFISVSVMIYPIEWESKLLVCTAITGLLNAVLFIVMFIYDEIHAMKIRWTERKVA